MNTVPSPTSTTLKPLRAWIPLLLLPLMIVARWIPRWFPETPMIWMAAAFGPGLIGMLILLWWLWLSRAAWRERAFGLVGLIIALVLTIFLLHHSMKGPPVIVMTLPMGVAGFAIALIFLQRYLSIRRTIAAVLVAFIAAGFSTLLKNEGAWGDFAFGLDWRWRTSPEEIFLAEREKNLSQPKVPTRIPTKASFENPQWPGFRGPFRDGVQRGTKVELDWKSSVPKEKWRIKLGPAWSSFAFADGFLVTQEQRDESEAVVCYDAETGQEVWSETVKSRFFEGLGGLGPRATPTIAMGSVFALGAEGWLLKINAVDGAIDWKVDIRQIANREPPMWGYACSPLVIGDLVVVHGAGKGDKGILAFDATDGSLRWSAASSENSYGSLHQGNLFGKQQLVLLSDEGALFLETSSGRVLLNYEFKIQGYRALQPCWVEGDQMLIPGEFAGTRLIQLKDSEKGILAEEVWTSRNLKPDFNDAVVHKGFLYGFDGAIFTCLDMKDGTRKWKGGRYGKGQVLLLTDSDLLLVVSETGELIVLVATPERHEELARLAALDGKTWNHPVVVFDKVYLRNAKEAVCYQLSE